MSQKQLFTDILTLIERYQVDAVFTSQAGLLSGSGSNGEGKITLLLLLRILFKRMLVSWGLIPESTQEPAWLQEVFPPYCPEDVWRTFSSYRFSRDASEENSSEVDLNLNIFSFLFEQYLNTEENRSGSFYTPEYIANAMCRAVIDRAGLDSLHQSDPGIDFTSLATLTSASPPIGAALIANLHEFLSVVSICDPSCGTGKFLALSANYLYELWMNLAEQEGLGMFTPGTLGPSIIASFRLYILEHSIFGVEKDPVTAEICKLHLFAWFLAALSSEVEQENFSLPDLSNIKVGNALIGYTSWDKLDQSLRELPTEEGRTLATQSFLGYLQGFGFDVTKKDLESIGMFHWPLEFNTPFTIAIGNPPYGNILSPLEKRIIRLTDPMVDDIYVNFLLKVVRGEIPCDYATFLTPKSFLLRLNYRDFRQSLLEQTAVYAITEVGSKKFKGALNEVQVLSFHRDPMYSSEMVIKSLEDKITMQYGLPGRGGSAPPIDEWTACENPACPGYDGQSQFYWQTRGETCPLCGAPAAPLYRIRMKLDATTYPIIHRIEEAGDLNFLNAYDFPDMKRGEEEKGLKRVKASLQTSGENNPNACGFLAARNDFASFALRPQKFFDLSAVQLQKERRFYQAGSKLLIKHNSIIPEAAFTRAPMCFTAAVYSLLCSDEKVLLYLCGVLNSTLMRFYCIFGINNQSAVTMNLNQYMIRHLPIVPYAQAETHAVRIIAIVEEVTEKSGTDGVELADGRAKRLEELDREVFALYQLEGQADFIARRVTEALGMFRKRKV